MKRLHLKSISLYIQMTVFLPIVLALLLVLSILVFHRMQQKPIIEEPIQQEVVVAPVGVLCILREEETIFYTVLTVDPSAKTVSAKPLTDSQTDMVYRQNGAAVLLDRLQEQGEAVDFYVDVTFEQMRQWLQYLGSGVGVTLQQEITYTDTAGLTVSFPSGNLELSANQTADMLRAVTQHTYADMTVARVWENIAKRYIIKDRNFMADYKALTDVGETDIRIYDFYRALPYLQKMTEKE